MARPSQVKMPGCRRPTWPLVPSCSQPLFWVCSPCTFQCPGRSALQMSGPEPSLSQGRRRSWNFGFYLKLSIKSSVCPLFSSPGLILHWQHETASLVPHQVYKPAAIRYLNLYSVSSLLLPRRRTAGPIMSNSLLCLRLHPNSPSAGLCCFHPQFLLDDPQLHMCMFWNNPSFKNPSMTRHLPPGIVPLPCFSAQQDIPNKQLQTVTIITSPTLILPLIFSTWATIYAPPTLFLSRLPVISILPNPMFASHWLSTLTAPPSSLKQLLSQLLGHPLSFSPFHSRASLQCLFQISHPLFVGGLAALQTTCLQLWPPLSPLTHLSYCITDSIPWTSIRSPRWHIDRVSS